MPYIVARWREHVFGKDAVALRLCIWLGVAVICIYLLVMEEFKTDDVDMPPEEETDCPICCDAYNKSTRSRVTCCYSDCGFSACKHCVREYLLGSTQDAHCMVCKKAWGYKFMVSSLNRSYMNAGYRRHRAALLADREIAKLGESMEQAQREKEARKYDALWLDKTKKIEETKQRLETMEREAEELARAARGYRNLGNGAPRERAKFVMPCPREECRGFLSTAYKCKICEYFACPRCLEVIGQTKEGHECNPDTVASAQLIKQQSKPCPECGTRISKISGCDQMWCVNCHTAFSWKTGRVDTGVVHNPHFFEYRRNGDTRPAPAQQQQGLNMCNPQRLPTWHQFRDSVIQHVADAKDSFRYSFVGYGRYRGIDRDHWLPTMFRTVMHTRQVEIPRMREKIAAVSNNAALRVKYILNDISKTELAKLLSTNDKVRTRLTETMNVYDLMDTVGIETIIGMYNAPTHTIPDVVNEAKKQMSELYRYCNQQFDNISLLYNVVQPYYNPETMTFGAHKREKKCHKHK